MLNIFYPAGSSIRDRVLRSVKQIGGTGHGTPENPRGVSPHAIHVQILGPARRRRAVVEAEGGVPRQAASDQRDTLQQGHSVRKAHGLLNPGVRYRQAEGIREETHVDPVIDLLLSVGHVGH